MEADRVRPTYAGLLSKWIDESGMTLRQLAELCDQAGQSVSFTYIGKVRAGSAPAPSPEVTNALAHALGKNPAPLQALEMIGRLDGEWQDLLWAALDLSAVDTSGEAESVLARLRNTVDIVKKMNTSIPEPAYLNIPVYDEPLVDGMSAPEQKGSKMLSPRDTPRVDYILQVNGNSFVDVGAWPGDWLWIERDARFKDTGMTVLVRIRNQVTARRYYEVPGSFRLEPPLLDGTPIDPAEVEFLGIVRGFVRKL